MEFSNSDGFIGKIQLRFIRVNSILTFFKSIKKNHINLQVRKFIFLGLVNYDKCIRKITSNSIIIYIKKLSKKDLKEKKQVFLVKNKEIQVITCMIMLTHSSERIFNPMCFTGYKSICKSRSNNKQVVHLKSKPK